MTVTSLGRIGYFRQYLTADHIGYYEKCDAINLIREARENYEH